MTNSCGGCKWFIKLKNDRFGGGLCDLLDARTKTDSKCKEYKRIKLHVV